MALLDFALPRSPFDVPVDLTAAQPAPAAFTWGAGGARLTPEQLAAQRESAMARMKSNYSPVGSVWEGLGRVADNLLGAYDSRQLDKEAAAQNADRTAQIAALLGPNADPNLVSGLGSSDKGVSSVAEMLWKAQQPKQRELTELEKLAAVAGYTPEQTALAAKQTIENRVDPWANIVVGGNSMFGRQSLLEQALKGGGQASGAVPGNVPPNQPPATLPADFDFGGPTQPASGNFP